jgi:hypothetical protein
LECLLLLQLTLQAIQGASNQAPTIEMHGDLFDLFPKHLHIRHYHPTNQIIAMYEARA